jgi:predicted outer membrane repeat protein
MSIIQCQFINNTASISGGAIFNTQENEELTIDQNIYENNMANAFGGAIYAIVVQTVRLRRLILYSITTQL